MCLVPEFYPILGIGTESNMATGSNFSLLQVSTGMTEQLCSLLVSIETLCIIFHCFAYYTKHNVFHGLLVLCFNRRFPQAYPISFFFFTFYCTDWIFDFYKIFSVYFSHDAAGPGQKCERSGAASPSHQPIPQQSDFPATPRSTGAIYAESKPTSCLESKKQCALPELSAITILHQNAHN